MLQLTLTPAVLSAVTPLAEGGDVKGAAVSLLLGVVQLVVSLALFTFAANQGIKVLSKMLEGLDIWAEIKKRNVAVALLAGGAIYAYTNVVSGGVAAMTSGLQGIVTFDFKAGLAATLAGAVNLVVALFVAGIAISWTFKVMDKWTKNIDEREEFKGGNVAIGVVYAGILIGASELISAGVSGVSSGLTAFFSALFA